jgi:hypothetical protein
MMNRLVGIDCENVGSIPLAKLLPKLNCEQVRPLVADLQKIDDTTVPWREVQQNENRFARAQLGDFPNPIKLVAGWWQTRYVRRVSAERHDLAAAHLRLLIVELALRAYRCDQGKGPESLKLLVPKYLQSLPMDPFSGNALIYRPMATNWLLYSLGPDRVDNGGKPLRKIISVDYLKRDSGNGDLFYDSE